MSCGNHVTTPCKVWALSVRSPTPGVVRRTTEKVPAMTGISTPISAMLINSSTNVKPSSFEGR